MRWKENIWGRKMDFKNIISALENKVKSNVEINENDYLDEEGLLVCGHCHTRKQVVTMFYGEKRTPYCLCKCASEKLKEKEEELKKKEFIQKIKDLRRTGFPDEEVANCRFEKNDSPGEVYSRAALNYVENFANMLESGKGLVFYGAVGTGKTFISACIVNALIDKGRQCLITNFARLVNTISGMHEGKQEYIDSLNEFDLLVIDDLAAERDTEYMNETVQNIIDSRYRLGKPLIVTTNLTKYELENPTNIKKERTYSRLLEMCILIEVNGPDRRRKKHINDQLKYKVLLGLE